MLSSIFITLTGLLAIAAALPTGQDIPGGAGLAVVKPREPVENTMIASQAIKPRLLPCYPTQKVTGDQTKGPGVKITNREGADRTYFIYQNSCDEAPYKYITVAKNQSKFVSLPELFQGRVVRGTEKVMLDGKPHTLGTWAELSFDEQGQGWGDISLIRGCDGAAEVVDLASKLRQGFTVDLLSDAPESILAKKDSGAMAITHTEGDGGSPILEPISYLWGKLASYNKAYLDDEEHSKPYPVIMSTTKQFEFIFYPGRP
ncbi:hypothetical protein F4778DRAFT_778587 [Xylariomycetidae sp. FL2044]|nr:hypothetical protein F4778DRAFT_778587 [Xylariomycetidae sp. FL2044]